ncbi:Spy/CpxP family protein refolding chaperone [Ottowia sp.]|jgi:Spy/CpxP family protein refolding chaperone|uniref:Spy/CpxP family protein refolding chaperone n=1 Tax=Ottowia sp. TaxID=1898956 RepID=UPI0025D65470|nr:Spy/CpxP family protein refolding chaperone [Ottowia sp.]MBK6615196.1 Spy/CpxP family protein refolding chaperone [Ottowia sp.]MBK6746272.1 Spy/CpxP family protein refolding chaperone [Ottowia sp.]
MKSWIRRTLFGALGATVLAGSLAGCAGHRDRWHEGDPGAWRARMVERVGHKLDLDAAQKQKLEVLAQKLQAQRQALRGDQAPRAQFRALFAGDKLDQAGANRLLDEKLAVLRAGSPEVIAAAADFFDHLNPAQQQKVRAFMERGRRWGRHG